jgi:outer membrane protein assembly factor BamB
MLAVFTWAAADLASALDWPQWRGPHRDATTSEAITLWPPAKLWQRDVGYGVSSVIEAGGRVYAMGHRYGSDTVYCLDGETGEVIWQHAYPAKSDQTSDVRFPGPRSTPATDGKTVYTLSLEGRLHALDAATGKVLWTKSPAETGASEKQQYGVCCPVLIHDEVVICDVATACRAFDKETGREIWRTAGGGGWNGAAPVVARFEGKTCVVHGTGRCVDLADGKELWRVPYGEMSVATPVISGKQVFLSPFHGRNLGGQGCALIRVHDARPQVVWNNDEVEGLCLTAVLHQGYLYAPDRDELAISGESGRKMNVKCIELETGKVRWVQRPIAWPTIIVAADKLLIQTLTGELILAEASPERYREYGRMSALPGRSWTVPALADGRLYCRNNRGLIVCLDVRGGGGKLATAASSGKANAQQAGPDRPQPSASATTPAPLAEVPPPKAAGSHWPRFRGLAGNGLSQCAQTPTTWNGRTGEGILWKAPVPLPGYSSPIVWGDRLFLTGADRTTRRLYCFDAASGTLRWQAAVPGAAGRTDQRDKPWNVASYAAPTPVTDGQMVWAMFADGNLACFDTDAQTPTTGKPVWARDLGVPKNSYGHASSLVQHADFVFVQLDQESPREERSRLLALDARSGNTVWEVKRPVGVSWSTPTVIDVAAQKQLITCGNPWVIGYAPDTGKELWRTDSLEGGYYAIPSPVYAAGLVFACTEGAVLSAIRPDARGEVSNSHVLWTAEDDLPDVCTPVSDGELLYVLCSDGRLTCYDCLTGKRIWQQDLSSADCTFQASPCLVRDRLYLLEGAGMMHIVAAGRTARMIGRAELGEACPGATPAFAAGRIFIRGQKHLYCIAPAEGR